MANLKVQKREGKGKYVAFNLRREGKIPGVVYGKSLKENINVTVNLKEFLAVLKTGDRIVDLDIDGKSMHVLLKAVQHGTYDHEILHADFRAISDTEKVDVELEIELRGDAAGVAVGGMLEQNLHHIGARCLPKDLPEKVVVDVTPLRMGEILYAKDLPAIAGVEYLFHGNPAVVSCHHPKGESAVGEGDVPSAPEVIGEKEREAKAQDKE
ncbi:MAG: 50S ribosomal protein L25 [Planctomycetes bacterium]|nr:50S ribosomal protein L25 [Planctomycetota bacterium]